MHKKIGVFDSGYGGLSILKELRKELPEYSFIYLGDNARVPYGTRSSEIVYQYTKECVETLFNADCQLIILACNTASAEALRRIQQNDLSRYSADQRVLGMIRPSAEKAGEISPSGHLGILATEGTILSSSYPREIHRFFPSIKVSQVACPLWVPLVENDEHLQPGADYFLQKNIQELLAKDPLMDSILLACTHYPLFLPKLRDIVPDQIRIISQGPLIARSLKDYLNRHPEINQHLEQSGKCYYFTTDSPDTFSKKAALFLGNEVTTFRANVHQRQLNFPAH